jgi:hypothetical protein
LVTLGHSEVVISLRKLRYRIGRPGLSQELLRAPQKPHKPATQWAVPTGIPRTKRHTPVHLLCVLKARTTAGQQRRCARAGLFEPFPGVCSRDDRAPEKRKVGRTDSSLSVLSGLIRESCNHYCREKTNGPGMLILVVKPPREALEEASFRAMAPEFFEASGFPGLARYSWAGKYAGG